MILILEVLCKCKKAVLTIYLIMCITGYNLDGIILASSNQDKYLVRVRGDVDWTQYTGLRRKVYKTKSEAKQRDFQLARPMAPPQYFLSSAISLSVTL